ncbi:hypothetical protein [Streptomyces sp. Z26]|uniref:hypothetical protein n=1 Tax=Streptomyces sp. Z26 TaxID=2500177 RepID=UPI000EF13465|nr:hypothetical protein [Streptomyces sp. Z26]RLL68166.1 hypothetical protein D7M15_16430 [Streptomyces sp. Z26]
MSKVIATLNEGPQVLHTEHDGTTESHGRGSRAGEHAGDANTSAACASFPGCIETGDHGDHQTETISVAPTGRRSRSYLGVYLIDFGDGPRAGFEGDGEWADLNSSGLRAEITKIRAHLVRMSAMADRLETLEIATRIGHQRAAAADVRAYADTLTDPEQREKLFDVARRVDEMARTTHIYLDEQQHDTGILAVLSGRDDTFHAKYDPRQTTVDAVDPLLRAELAWHEKPPKKLIISTGGTLAVAPLPEGEPMRIVERGDGGVHVVLDTAQAPAEEVKALLASARAEKAGE